MLTGSLSIENMVENILREQKEIQEAQKVSQLPDEATDRSGVSVSSKLMANARLQAAYMNIKCEKWRLDVEKVAEATRSEISDSDEKLKHIADSIEDEADNMSVQIVFLNLSYFRTSLSDTWKPYKKDYESIGKEAIRACTEVRNVYRNMARAIRMHINHNPVDYPLVISESELSDHLKKTDNFFSSMGM